MDREVREHGARIARDYFSNNGVRIELGQSINGSGAKAFGGAKRWPCLRVEIGFPEGDEKRMATVAKAIEYVLIKHDVIQNLGDAVLEAGNRCRGGCSICDQCYETETLP